MAEELDIDQLDELVKKDKERSGEGKRDKERERDRDRDRDDRHSRRDDRHRSGSGSRRRRSSRSPHKSKSPKRARVRSTSAERRQRDLEAAQKREIERRELELKARQREEEQARRDDSTVLVLKLHPKAGEREIYEFFSKAAGKVRDVRIIKDQRSGKSKGVAYVEFYEPTTVYKAISLSGSVLMDQQILVQVSQAEKNRVAAAQKAQKAMGQESEGSMRVYVGGFTDHLANISEDEVKSIFEPFGEVELVDLHRDPMTGKRKGYGFVQFRRAQDARRAIQSMQGFTLAGKQLKIGAATDHKMSTGPDTSVGIGDLDDEGGGMQLNASSRALLMQKLQRDSNMGGIPTVMNPYMAYAQSQAAPAVTTGPTSCLHLRNMFNLATVNLQEEPDFFRDIREDVQEECTKYGDVAQCWVDTSASSQGSVWVKFEDTASSVRAQQALNGRYFAGAQIGAEFVSDAVFKAKVSGV
eukprot:GILJ01003472.1.p1 GENE.GILJ01003472.1~~GILJ01003472.1.p1  ORF type:complete len:486 (-),score=71.99 GILJ01003472.1:36-1442(-)